MYQFSEIGNWIIYEVPRLIRIGFIHKLCFFLDFKKNSTEISTIVDLCNVQTRLKMGTSPEHGLRQSI